MKKLTLAMGAVLAALATGLWILQTPANPEGRRSAASFEDRAPRPKRPDRHPDTAPSYVPATVVVRDSKGRPIQGARVSIVNVSGFDATGMTDGQGEWTWAQPAPKPRWIHCWHPDYAEELQRVIGQGTARYRVVLKPGATLRGEVVTPEGLPPPEGLRVVAWYLDALPPLDETASGARACLIGATDREGKFVLPGAKPDLDYAVCAGGKGWLTADPSYANDKRAARLHAHPLYGAVLAPRVDGQTEHVWPPGRSVSFVKGFKGFRIFDGESLLRCAGLDLAALRTNRGHRDWSRILLLYAGLDDFARPHLKGQIRFEVQGLDADEHDLYLTRLRGSAIPTQTLRAYPSAESFGELGVRLLSDLSTDDLDRFCASDIPCELELIPAAGGRDLRITIPRTGAQELVVRHIPAGRYRARLRLATNLILEPDGPQVVEIGARRASTHWDLRRFGVFTLSDSGLDRLIHGRKGMLSIFVNGGKTNHFVDCFPCVSPLLEEGKYKIVVSSSRFGRPARVKVNRGRVSRVHIDWRQ